MRPELLSFTHLGAFLLTLFSLHWWQRVDYPLELWLCLIGLLAISIPIALLKIAPRASLLFLAATVGVSCAFMAVTSTTHEPTLKSIDAFAQNQHVTIVGTIIREPDRRPLFTNYTVRVELFEDAFHKPTEVDGLILLRDKRMFPPFQYGDRVLIKGVLELPPAGQYKNYLSLQNIHAILNNGSLSYSGEGSGHSAFFGMMFRLKEIFESHISGMFPEPHAAFLAGLLTGSRRGIAEHLLEDFQITGLTHIIAISGYNITIILTIIAGALFWVPVKWRIIPSVLLIVAFTLFVGASAAVVRAAVMGILGLLALQSNRAVNGRLLIGWTLFFMLMWNPKYLWYDAGFQLSFLAVIGLLEISPLMAPLFKKLGIIGEMVCQTLSANIITLPWIAFLFGRISLISPLANILVAPVVPFAMLFGFLGTISSFISFFLGQLFSFLAFGMLSWAIFMTKLLADVPLASVELEFKKSIVIGSYLFLSIGVFFLQKKYIHHS